MRFVRLPYFYLPDSQVRKLTSFSHYLLRIIHDVHHDIPNEKWYYRSVKAFMYHPSFLRWVFVKAQAEMRKRGFSSHLKLTDGIIQLRSRPLAEFVPPTDADLAEDIVWLLDSWKKKLAPGGIKLPQSYSQLARQHYGYSPQQAAIERVDQIPGRSRDADREWYNPQGEEASQIDRNSLGGGVRRRRHANG